MTSMVAWIGVDSHGPASVYLASDSRISWSATSTWDYGRKLFASRRCPDILGYVGDVLFPSQVLGQIVEHTDAALLFYPDTPSVEKFKKICEVIRECFERYPRQNKKAFTVVFATRESSRLSSRFRVASLRCDPAKAWQTQWHDLPERSGLIRSLGSGRESVEKWYHRWLNTAHKRTSRSVFSAFCDSLHSGEDRRSGGPPQLVGIYRIGPARTFGTIYHGQRFLFGLPAKDLADPETIEWRNSLFERCDPQSLERLDDAQKHRAPHGLGKERT